MSEDQPNYTPKKSLKLNLLPTTLIERRIFLVHGHKVMLDSDLADLYAVETKTLNRAVKRNIERFPEDFMFPLTREEYNSLRYQFGTLKKGQHAKYLHACLYEAP